MHNSRRMAPTSSLPPTTSRQRNKPLPITIMLSRGIAYLPHQTACFRPRQAPETNGNHPLLLPVSSLLPSPLTLCSFLSLVPLVISLLVLYPLSCFLYWCTYRHSSTLMIKSEAIINSISCREWQWEVWGREQGKEGGRDRGREGKERRLRREGSTQVTFDFLLSFHIQIAWVVEDGKVNDKYFAEAEEEVERYFSRCEQALAARKEGLLRELAQKLTDQSMSSSVSFSPSSTPLFTLYTKREGSDGCTRRSEQGHQGKEEDAEGRLIRVRDRYQISWTYMEGMMIILPSFSHRPLSSPFSWFLSLPLLPTTAVSFSTLWTHLLNAGSHQSAMASSLSGKDEVRPLQLILRAHPSTWQRYITFTLHSQNGHKWLTLFHHHLSCAAAGWQARSSTWEDIGSWCLSAPLQGKDSGSRGPSSGDRVQIFDCKWVTKTR